MIGAYVGFAATTYASLSFFPALVISMLTCAALGVIIERVAYKPLRASTRIAVLITAIGMSLLLEYVMMFFVGAEVRSYPKLLENKSFYLGDIIINTQQIYIVITAVALMMLLQYIVHKTKMGKAMRAVSIDRDAAQLMGIKIDSTISFTFALGSAFAGAAGVLVGIYYNSIDPLMGVMPGLKAFIAAVFGGIGNIPGAMIGGMTIGIMETLVSGYGNSMYRDAVVFAFLIIILILKPSGLLGKNIREKV
jgi:branched-chain amino acid transport system permease protein